MATIAEYARLAEHCYHPHQSQTSGMPIARYTEPAMSFHSAPPPTVPLFGWHYVTDVSPTMHPSKHFFAALYLKFYAGHPTEAVLAIRGTVVTDFDNIRVDINSWFSDVMGDGSTDELPYYTHEAYLFFCHAVNYLSKLFPNCPSLKLTGHSLGGAIAKLLVCYYGVNTYCVSFNAPGLGNMPGVQPGFAGWITQVNSRYDVLNKIGKAYAPTIYYIDVPDHALEARTLIENFLVNQNYHASIASYKISDNARGQTKTLAYTMKPGLHDMAITAVGASLSAATDRFMAYWDSIKILEGYPATLVLADGCQQDHYHDDHGIHLLNKVINVYWHQHCQYQSTFKEVANVVAAQHAIHNLVIALAEPRYSYIAEKRI